MKSLRHYAFGSLVAVFIMSSAVMGFAGDPPSRVARLKYTSGQVSMQPGGVDDWAEATVNRPMTTADRLWTDKDSRAELHLGSAALRMNSETSLTLANISDNAVQLQLDQGTLNLQVARLSRDEIYEVDTPNAAFTILKSGMYRFDVDSNGDTTLITVWKGKGIASGDGSDVSVDSRRQVRFSGGRSLAHLTFNAPDFDAFDQWCRGRGEHEAYVVSARYVSPDVIGYEDLDEYGRWRVLPGYGGVWFPTRVAVGWAPYRYGHWVWVEPWGWTWVDDAAWGFAPFHYGRWVFVAGSWGWVPGPIHVRPWYAPALVAWIGGSDVNVGWFPLGYGEPYIPSYRVSRDYFRTVNISNTRITNITYVTNNYYNVENVRITNINYVNRERVTIVDRRVIVDSRHVDREVFEDHDRGLHLGRDRWIASCPPVPPSHNSVLGLHGGERAPVPRDRVLYRPVVIKMAPPARPLPFEAKREDLERHGGRPLDSGEEDRLRRRMPQPVESASRDRGPRNDPDRGREQRPADDHGDRGRNASNGNGNNNDHRDFPSRVPRPPRSEDPEAHGDHDRQASAGNGNHRDPDPHGNPDPHVPAGRDRNNDRNNDRADNRRNAQNNGPDRQGPSPDNNASERHVPRPPSADNDREARNPRQPSDGSLRPYDPQPQHGNEDHRGPQESNGPGNGARDNSPAGRSFPRPPQSGGDRNASGNSMQQGDRSVPRPFGNERGNGTNPGPAPDRGNSHPPMQQPSPMGVMDRPQNSSNGNSRNNDRSVPRPSFGDRGAASPPPVQQAERATPMPMPRPSQPERNDSHPAPPQRMPEPARSAPPQHMPETARSAPPESHSAGSRDSGSRGDSHGSSQSQGHANGKSHDRDSAPK